MDPVTKQLKVFVSHSHEDDTFCRQIVSALRSAGADVWYDEHNLGSGQLMEVIQRELEARPIFVLILSKHAFASKWVKRETTWAYDLYDRYPSRLILPVTAGPIDRDDFSGATGWLFMHDFMRIEAAGYQPFSHDEAIRRTLRILTLTPTGDIPASVAPQPTESADDLLARGKALQAQDRHDEARQLFERAAQLAPDSFDAWANLALTLNFVHSFSDALPAHERATALDPTSAIAWSNRGAALGSLKRSQEALAALARALALDPNNAIAWYNRGTALMDLNRYKEALVAYDRTVALDPNYAPAWYNKGNAFRELQRNEEALAAYDRALTINRHHVNAWSGKAALLHLQGRYNESLAAREQQLRIEPMNARGWSFKAVTLRALGRYAEAEQADRRANELGA